MRRVPLILGLAILGACSRAGSGAVPDTTTDTIAARSLVTKLEAEARAIAKTDQCPSAGQCRVAPVGERPCGGPRTYLAYCAATTDSVALYRKLDELKAAESRLNQAAHEMSSCQLITPPLPGFVAGRCTAP